MAVAVGVKCLKTLNYLVIFIGWWCCCLTQLCSNKASLFYQSESGFQPVGNYTAHIWRVRHLVGLLGGRCGLLKMACGRRSGAQGASGLVVTGGCSSSSPAKSKPADSSPSATGEKNRLGKDFFLLAISEWSHLRDHLGHCVSIVHH